jgi:hypothetical protein
MIRIPAATAHQKVDVLGFDDETAQIFQLKAKVATITLGNRIFTGRKPVAHQ